MGSGQQFNLRWNNHTNNILQVFMEHLNSELLVDVSLSCEGKFLKAHKMVLSACSPYFQELFKLHQLPHPVIIFNGIGFSELKLVVEFMYRGEIKVLESDLQTVLQTAEALQVKGLSTVRNKYDEAAAAAAISQHQQQQLQQQQQLFKVVSSNVDCSNTNSNTTTVSNNTNGNSAVAASANPSCTDVGSGLSHFAKTIKPVTDPFKTRTRLHKIVQKEKRIDSLSQNILKNDSNNKKQTVEKSLLLASLSSQKKFDTDNNLVSPACVRLSNATQLMTTGGNLPSKKVTDEDDSICNNDNGNNENNANDNNSDDRNGSSDDNNDGDDDDDDLPAMIKVEPPDIRDIDGEPLNNEDYENSSSPKLVIDVPEDHSNGNLISSATKVKKVIKPQLQSIPPSDLKSSIKDDSSNHKYSSYKRQYSWLRSGKIPRPPNAFMIFANEWRRKLAYQHPLESNKDISVRLGMMWKNLTVDAKENYYKASRKADEDHKKKYPGYYYSPKEARIRKNLKLRNRLTPGSNNDGSNTNNNGHSSSNIDELTLVKVFMTNEKNEQVSSNTGAFAKGEQPKWRKISPKKAYNKFADHEKTAETDINDVNVSDSEMKKTNLKRENTNELLCTKLDGEIKKVKLEINNTEMDDESVEEQEEEDIHNRREYHNDGDGGGNDNCTNNEGESQEMIKDKSASVTVN